MELRKRIEEILKEDIDTNAKFIEDYVHSVNIHKGTARDAFAGMPKLSNFNWDIKTKTIHPDDPNIDKANLWAHSKRDVKRYMKAYEKGSKFPPIVITVKKSGKYAIQDGAHRLEAAINLNVPIEAYIGTLKE